MTVSGCVGTHSKCTPALFYRAHCRNCKWWSGPVPKDLLVPRQQSRSLLPVFLFRSMNVVCFLPMRRFVLSPIDVADKTVRCGFVLSQRIITYQLIMRKWQHPTPTVSAFQAYCEPVLPLGSLSSISDCCLFQHQILSDFYVTVLI